MQQAEDLASLIQNVVTKSYHAAYNLLPSPVGSFLKENVTPDSATGMLMVLPGAGKSQGLAEATGATGLVDVFEPWLMQFKAAPV